MDYEVIIIGAGPAGLAAARSLLEDGVKNLLLIEREKEAGGVPRHCQHPTFGLQTFSRPMSGHRWAARILAQVEGRCEIRTSTTVVAVRPGGEMDISSDRGLETVKAKRVIIATGVRETPRHARLIGGVRPQGVLTAGALQQFIYLKKLLPGARPVVVGSELVSFSSLWTLRHAGIKALALLDDSARPVAFRPCLWFARLLGVKVHLAAHISKINGNERVESIEYSNRHGAMCRLDCDSVIFTGKFTGEYTLIRNSHLQHEPQSGRPLFDQSGRCSDPHYYVTGNMTHPADMGDQCYQEGQRTGHLVAKSLKQPLTEHPAVRISLEETFRLSAPNTLTTGSQQQAVTLNVRVNRPHSGQIIVRDGERELYRGWHRCLPERRILLKNIDISGVTPDSKITVQTQ